MPEIDLEPREHSSSYEIKPMSRWWLVLVLALAALAVIGSGAFEARTWAVFFCGMMVAAAAVLCFPRTFLTKDR